MMANFLCTLALISTTLGDIPSQVRIAFAGVRSDGTPDGMSIGWYTNTSAATMVQYGLVSAGLTTNVTTITTKQYLPDKYGFHHSTTLTGLTSNAQYNYRIGDNTNGWTNIFEFTAAPDVQDITPFGISMFGDMGYLGQKERHGGLAKDWSAVPTRTIIETLKNNKQINFLWHLGDIAYADDSFDADPLHFGYETVYNGFMNWMQNISSIMPYMVAVGNHESECHSPACIASDRAKDLRNFSAYNARYNMPAAASNGVDNMWYSWNYGPVHFISINTETDFKGAPEEHRGDSGVWPAGGFGRDGEYLAWLEADLKAANESRGVRPWIIAGGHRPIEEKELDATKALLLKYDVDLYACGHEHSYYRTPPFTKDGGVATMPNPSHYHATPGMPEVVAGGAGCDEMARPKKEGFEKYKTDQLGIQVTPVYSTAEFASGLLTVTNTSALHYQLISSMDGTILDEFWLTK